MYTRSISLKYARALFKIAYLQKIHTNVLEELKLIATLLEKNESFKRVLFHPTINQKKKKEILKSVLGKQVSNLTLNFLYVLLSKHREELFTEIADAFEDVFLENINLVLAKVRTPIPLSADQQNLLKNKLSKRTGKKVELQIIPDTSILGGMIISIGDVIIDGTINYNLELLRKKLLDEPLTLEI